MLHRPRQSLRLRPIAGAADLSGYPHISREDVLAALSFASELLKKETLIRRSLEKDIQQDPVADAKAFFERLKPLESFADTEPEAYVRKLRNTSRLFQAKTDDA